MTYLSEEFRKRIGSGQPSHFFYLFSQKQASFRKHIFCSLHPCLTFQSPVWVWPLGERLELEFWAVDLRRSLACCTGQFSISLEIQGLFSLHMWCFSSCFPIASYYLMGPFKVLNLMHWPNSSRHKTKSEVDGRSNTQRDRDVWSQLGK